MLYFLLWISGMSWLCWSLHLAEWIFNCLNLLISRLCEVSQRDSSSYPFDLLPLPPLLFLYYLPFSLSQPDICQSTSYLSLSPSPTACRYLSALLRCFYRRLLSLPWDQMWHKRAQIMRFNAVAYFRAIHIF